MSARDDLVAAMEARERYLNADNPHDKVAASDRLAVDAFDLIIDHGPALLAALDDRTKYEQMAKAVMEAWDQWHSLNALLEPMPYHLGAMNIAVGVVEAATNKHPSEWTRESLAEWLGVNDVEQARLKFLADGGML